MIGKPLCNRILMTFVALMVAGCAAHDKPVAVADLDTRYEQQRKQIDELKTQVAEQEAARKAAEAKVGAAQREAERLAQAGTSSAAGSGSSSALTSGSALLPPNAAPGECYARVLVPPVLETRSEQVLLKEASERIEVSEATYDWGEEKIETKAASYKIEVVPATYGVMEEKILTKPARKELRVVPAVYDTETEQVLVAPERTYWKRGRGPVEKLDNATGEIMCLVTEPARYQTVTKQVLKTPERVEEVEIPAEYTTVKRLVVKDEATTRRVEIPAEYSTVKVLEQTKPPSEKRHEIPAQYGAVEKREMVKESYLEWRPVICETNMNGDFVRRLQNALRDAGNSPGPIDGIYGPQTRSALHAFQIANGLPTGGLTYSTVEKLGLSL